MKYLFHSAPTLAVVALIVLGTGGCDQSFFDSKSAFPLTPPDTNQSPNETGGSTILPTPTPSTSATPHTLIGGGYVSRTSPLQTMTIDVADANTDAHGFNIASAVDLTRCLGNVNHTLTIVPCADEPRQVWTQDFELNTISNSNDCLDNQNDLTTCKFSPPTPISAALLHRYNGTIGDTNNCLALSVASTAPYAASASFRPCDVADHLQQWVLFRRVGTSNEGMTLGAWASTLCLQSIYSVPSVYYTTGVATCAASAAQRWILQGDQLINVRGCATVHTVGQGQVLAMTDCADPNSHGWGSAQTNQLTYNNCTLVSDTTYDSAVMLCAGRSTAGYSIFWVFGK